ncbi:MULTISPECIES: response regulator transcription factor [Bacillaceae]|uniref:Response regulator transcription factor n=1 Tax=Evansella alkalicola TaxID=745819 RepID=A0ABS6JRU0_9BACI|nr:MULTISPECIES: response regulator transcription factor [Bacillaceae]MBU9721277.1 response regulator transcription factor [Bacillus alkalicola]
MKAKAIKILIIEDDPNIAELISMYMEKLGYESIIAADGEEGLTLFFDRTPDCIILDLMLPKMDGWDVCKTIRLEDSKVPILMLTGKGQSHDIVNGLGLGADDYIVKPFDPNELSARVKAALRRTVLSEEYNGKIILDNVTINMAEFRVYVNEEEVVLAPREMEILHYFACHPNQVLSRQQLLDKVWGYDFEGDPRTLDVHIKRIRDKLGQHGAKWSVTTIRGVGYRFEGKVKDRV